MNAINVQPKDWLWDINYPIRVLYDDTDYSVIWGKYKGEKCLGVRWNGFNNDRGYPGQADHPTWYVEPDFIAPVILDKVLSMAVASNDLTYFDNISFAIRELNSKTP